MFLVVTYDITENKRLKKMHKFLKNFGVPVQYSVFECDLNREQIRSMTQGADEIMDLKEDALLIYAVCRECRHKTQVIGQGEVWVDSEWWVY